MKPDFFRTDRKIIHLWVVLILLVPVLLVYLPTLEHDFIRYDDELYVTENPIVRKGISLDTIIAAFHEITAANWHPLTLISHMLDVELFGMNPGMHHMTNIFFHYMNTVLLYFLLYSMTKAFWPCVFAAALFAVHPLHVETVAQVAQRKDLLSTFFWFLLMLCYSAYVKKESKIACWACLVFFVSALLSKPMAVTAPFLLLVLDYWPYFRLNRKSFGFLVWEKIPFIVISAFFAVFTFHIQQVSGAVRSFSEYSFCIRLANAFVSYAMYLYKMIFPADLAFYYPHPGFPGWVKLWVSIMLLSGITALVFIKRKKTPFLVTGWLWYLGTLLPVSGIIQAGSQAMADRYAYVPFVGICIMVSFGAFKAADACGRNKKLYGLSKIIPLICVLLITGFTVVAGNQAKYWKNSESLFIHAIHITRNNHVALNNLGLVYAEKGDYEKATHYLQKAIQAKPGYAPACNNLGDVFLDTGKTEKAISLYKRALSLSPDYAKAEINLGVALSRAGRYENALVHLKEGIRKKPDIPMAYVNLGACFMEMGKNFEAEKAFQKAIALDPHIPEAHSNLAVLLYRQNRMEKALHHMRIAFHLDPDDPGIRKNYLHLQLNQIKKRDQTGENKFFNGASPE